MKTLLLLAAIIAIAAYFSGLLAIGIMIGAGFAVCATLYQIFHSRTL